MTIEFLKADDSHTVVKSYWGNMRVTSGIITHAEELVLFEGRFTIE